MWTADKIKYILNNAASYTLVNGKRIRNSFIIYRLLQRLYERQTADEQAYATTNNLNSVGFTAFDASFLTEIAQKSAEYMNKNRNDYGLNVFWGVFKAKKAKAANLLSPKFQNREDAEKWAADNRPKLFADEVFVLAGGQAAMVGSMLVKYANTQLEEIAQSFAGTKGGDQTCEPEGYTAPAPKVRKSRKTASLEEVETKTGLSTPELAQWGNNDAARYERIKKFNDRNENVSDIKFLALAQEAGITIEDLQWFSERQKNDPDYAAANAKPEVKTPVITPETGDQYEIEGLVQELKENNPEAYYSDGEMDEEEAHDFWFRRFSQNRTTPVGGR